MIISLERKKIMYKIFTDGACKRNGKTGAKGGWAFAIYDEHNNLMFATSGHEENTTNQRMEIIAILKGCEKITELMENNEFFTCEICSDSAYCIRCHDEAWYDRWESNGWRTSNREKVKNRELWEALIPFFKDCRFDFKKVKGHADCEENNFVDELAQRAAVSELNCFVNK